MSSVADIHRESLLLSIYWWRHGRERFPDSHPNKTNAETVGAALVRLRLDEWHHIHQKSLSIQLEHQDLHLKVRCKS